GRALKRLARNFSQISVSATASAPCAPGADRTKPRPISNGPQHLRIPRPIASIVIPPCAESSLFAPLPRWSGTSWPCPAIPEHHAVARRARRRLRLRSPPSRARRTRRSELPRRYGRACTSTCRASRSGCRDGCACIPARTPPDPPSGNRCPQHRRTAQSPRMPTIPAGGEGGSLELRAFVDGCVQCLVAERLRIRISWLGLYPGIGEAQQLGPVLCGFQRRGTHEKRLLRRRPLPERPCFTEWRHRLVEGQVEHLVAEPFDRHREEVSRPCGKAEGQNAD